MMTCRLDTINRMGAKHDTSSIWISLCFELGRRSSHALRISLPLLCRCQGVTMVSTPPKPAASTTASAPLSQDQFNAYVQNTYGRYPLTIVRGEGCKLFDSDGKVSL